MKTVAFGIEEHERIELTVLSYERPASGEYYDDNWLSCEIRVRAGVFRGKFSANLLTFELARLYAELLRLHSDLRGKVTFKPMEEQLVATFTCDNLGHIHVSGAAMDEAGIGHQLKFRMSFDQTHLANSLNELGQVVRSFPVRT
jgi:hypothetical protein